MPEERSQSERQRVRNGAAPAPAPDHVTASFKIGYLSAMEIFQDLGLEEIEQIKRAVTMHTFPKGRVFYAPGEIGEVLVLLKKGAVEIYQMSPEGRKLIVATLGPYSVFGEMSLIGQGMYSAFAEAIEESLVCTMSRSDVERLILAKPSVALRILEAVGRRIMENERQLGEPGSRSRQPLLFSNLGL